MYVCMYVCMYFYCMLHVGPLVQPVDDDPGPSGMVHAAQRILLRQAGWQHECEEDGFEVKSIDTLDI